MSESNQRVGRRVGLTRIVARLRCLIDALLPPMIEKDPEISLFLKRWLLLGLMVRLFFMPFAAHNDYLSEHWRAEQVAFRGVVYPTRLELGSHYLDALTMRLIAPLVPEHAQLFWSPEAEEQSQPHAEPPEYLRFAAYSGVNRALFLTKIPYLIFDLAGALILLHIFDDPLKAKRAFVYWLANPVMIFAVYIFGRYEAYAAALVLLSLLLLSRDKKAWGAAVLGFAVLFRTSMLLIVPIYMMAISGRWVKRLSVGAIALLPVAVTLGVFDGLMGLSPAFVSSRDTGFVSLLLNYVGTLRLHPYVIGYVIILLALYLWPEKSSDMRRYALGGLFVFQLILIATRHSIVYYTWTMPFFVWLLGDNQRMVKYFWWQVAGWAFYWLVATDGGVFTPYLFTPLSSVIGELRPTATILEFFGGIGLELAQVIGIARSVLAALSLWVVLFAVHLEIKREALISHGEVTHE